MKVSYAFLKSSNTCAVFLALFLVGQSDAASQEVAKRRIKRFVDGKQLIDRSNPYRATEYYVLIGGAEVHCEPINDEPWKGKRRCIPQVGDEVCSGSLLTPKVVQTACHCLAEFSARAADGKIPSVKKPEWETSYTIFAGRSDLTAMNYALKSKKTYVHQKCQKLQQDPPGWITHNSGLILTEDSTEEEPFITVSNGYNIGYADLYKKHDIYLLWEENEFKGPTCLALSFGMSRVPGAQNLRLFVLSHGWFTLQEYWRCYFYTMTRWNVNQRHFPYSESATWGCMVNRAGSIGRLRPVDGGAPISCNNLYWGFFQSEAPIPDGPDANKTFNLIGTIPFTLFENAAEYRKQLIQSIEEWSKHPEELQYLATPPRPDLIPHKPHSSGVLKITTLLVTPWTLLLLSLIMR